MSHSGQSLPELLAGMNLRWSGGIKSGDPFSLGCPEQRGDPMTLKQPTGYLRLGALVFLLAFPLYI